MLKIILKVLVVFFILIVLLAGGVLYWWQDKGEAVSTDKTPKNFLVLKGSSASSVGTKLEKEGFIRSALAFKIYLRATGKAQKILPGSYVLSKSLSMKEIVEMLLKGPKDLWVTVPEGRRREEVAYIFADGLEKSDTDKIVFVDEFLEETKDLEGYLFPDTYLFSREATASIVVKRMKALFDSQTADLQKQLSEKGKINGLNLDELIVLASIVERETKNDNERPIVAGILYNRLDIDMALQADATVQYVLGAMKCQLMSVKCETWWPTPLKEDLKIKSPYNTYLNTGLPPTPIANPGLSSIKAVFEPKESSDLYYIHDKNGDIHTAETFEEHTKNINQYLR